MRRRYLLVAPLFLGLSFVAAQFGSAADPRNQPTKPGKSLMELAHPPDDVAKVLRTSCYDCHSSETRWPWYSHLPFIGSQLETHVNDGRLKLDFTDWQSHIDAFEREDKLEDICIQAKARKMPMPQYLVLHPTARLSDDDVQTLCRWTDAERDKPE